MKKLKQIKEIVYIGSNLEQLMILNKFAKSLGYRTHEIFTDYYYGDDEWYYSFLESSEYTHIFTREFVVGKSHKIIDFDTFSKIYELPELTKDEYKEIEIIKQKRSKSKEQFTIKTLSDIEYRTKKSYNEYNEAINNFKNNFVIPKNSEIKILDTEIIIEYKCDLCLVRKTINKDFKQKYSKCKNEEDFKKLYFKGFVGREDFDKMLFKGFENLN